MGKSGGLLKAAGRGDTAGVQAALESGADIAEADAQVRDSERLELFALIMLDFTLGRVWGSVGSCVAPSLSKNRVLSKRDDP